MKFTAADIERVQWDKSTGLVPAIVQHARTGAVLMLAYMNRAALEATLTRGKIVFFSRSRQALWEKGETSGHTLSLVDLRLDCDADTVLVLADPAGPTCHTGSITCFGNERLTAAERLSFLAQLEAVIAERARDPSAASYTAKLLASGVRRVAQKVGEEGVEVALAGAADSDAAVLSESADLVYHLLVLLRARGLHIESVIEQLEQRHRPDSR